MPGTRIKKLRISDGITLLTDTEDDTELDDHEDGEHGENEHNLDTARSCLELEYLATEDTGDTPGSGHTCVHR